MNDFSLGKMPEFIFGHKAEEKCAELIKRYGGTRVLIHHSGEPFVMPLIEKVRGILEASFPILDWILFKKALSSVRKIESTLFWQSVVAA